MRVPLSRRVAAWLLSAWTLVVAWTLLSPTVPVLAIPLWSYLTNGAHAVFFGVEALLLGLVLAPGAVSPPRGRWLAASCLALGYAAAVEWTQSFVPGRHSSWADMLTNAVGAFGAPWALAPRTLLTWRPVVVAVAAAAAAVVAVHA